MKKTVRSLAQEFWSQHQFLADPADADGRCLWAVMAFAAHAADHGHAVHLARWQATSGPYTDHWAVVAAYDEVFDFTRAQVDCRRGFEFSNDSYPTRYKNRKYYPAELFLKEFSREQDKTDGRMSHRFTNHVLRSVQVYNARNAPKLSQRWGGWLFASFAILFCCASWRLLSSF